MMEVKKNPKKDLNQKSGIFFIAGLAMVLALTYVALEWKTFYEHEYVDVAQHIEPNIDEEVPVVEWKTPPPPPPPVAPLIIEIVPDEEDFEETVIESSEIDEETEVLEIKDVETAEVEEDVDVPFILVEDAPVFPGCENDSDKKACFNKMMNKHIRKNFRYPTIAQEMNIQGKVYMHFVIQKDGSIGNIQIARTPDKNLGAEATRIIGKLPKMQPGKQRGNPVRVPFSIPITFKLSN